MTSCPSLRFPWVSTPTSGTPFTVRQKYLRDHHIFNLIAIGFFEHINLLYGTVSEFCNLSSCPEMTGPGPRLYMWLDDKGKKSKLSAPQYVDYVMTYVQKVVNDETVFPTKHGNEFPANFETVLKKVQKLLFHVVAHIYHSHFKEVIPSK